MTQQMHRRQRVCGTCDNVTQSHRRDVTVGSGLQLCAGGQI